MPTPPTHVFVLSFVVELVSVHLPKHVSAHSSGDEDKSGGGVERREPYRQYDVV